MAGTVLGPTVVVDGELSGSDPLVVHGTVKGRVVITAAMVVDDDGRVEADIQARTLEVRGSVTGQVTAQDMVDVHATAHVVGDIRAPRVLIADGANFKGNVDVEP